MSRSVPILMYHLVSSNASGEFAEYNTVTPGAFASQMDWLSKAGYSAVTLDDLLDYRAGRSELPRRAVVITFDDGYQDLVEYAVPALRRHGFTACFFLVAGLVGDRSRWLKQEFDCEFSLFDWATARALEEQGFTCGAHTMTHPRLADESLGDCCQEIAESRRILEKQLGHTVHHFAYPYGSFNEEVRSIVSDLGFRSACSVRLGFSGPNDDPFALHRIPVTGRDSLFDFVCRLRWAHSFWEWRLYKVGLFKQRMPFLQRSEN